MPANTLTLEDLIRRTGDLPSQPATAMAVIRETDQPGASAGTIAQYLVQDQALTARILRLANSSYYGLPGQVMDVAEAVVVLGTRCIKNLCTVASTYPWMVNPFNGFGLGPQEIWSHSYAVGIGAQTIAEEIGHPASRQAMTAGILHNLGKMALATCHEGRMSKLIDEARRSCLPLEAVESKVLGYNHCDIGGQIAEAWNLPKPLIEVMRHHHNPDACESSNPLVDFVHVADYLTMSMGLGLGGDGLCYDFKARSLERLNLGASDLDRMATKMMAACDQQKMLFETADASLVCDREAA
jgi:putative nucleotidyltransferase with HDIG domain